MKNKIVGGISLALFVLLILLLRTVDRAPIGPEGTTVGLSTINGALASTFPFDQTYYFLSKACGYCCLLTAFVFFVIGVVQVGRRRRIAAVDSEIRCLEALYVTMGLVYVLFEKLIINYRPVIIPGEEIEPSFPSSHTLLALVIMGSAILVVRRYERSGVIEITASALLQFVCIAMLLLTVVTRIISGVHWFTDYVGAVLIGVALLAGFREVVGRMVRREAGQMDGT